MKKKRIIVDLILLLSAGLLIFIDQWTKVLVANNLINGKEAVIWKDVFKIVFHKNTGCVWGMFSDKTDVLSVLTFFILIVVFYVFFKLDWKYKKFRPMKIISMLVVAGAIGNLIDRMKLKYVVDFLYFELIDFPVFNVADCYITVSMIVLLILVIFYYKDEDFELIWPKKSQ